MLKGSGILDVLLLLCSLTREGLPTVPNAGHTGMRREAKNDEKPRRQQCTFKIIYFCS